MENRIREIHLKYISEDFIKLLRIKDKASKTRGKRIKWEDFFVLAARSI